MEPEAGFEPAAYALRVRCSTPELPRRGRNGSEIPTTPSWEPHGEAMLQPATFALFLA